MGIRTCKRDNARRAEAVARAIYAADGWTHWPLDATDPDRGADVIVAKYTRMAHAAISTFMNYEAFGESSHVIE